MKIAVLAGDGIGPEIMPEAIKCLKKIGELYGHEWVFKSALVGGAAWEEYGVHFPDETKQVCEESDAILFGSVGGPIHEQQTAKWKDCERNSILAIRQHFRFHANLRPVKNILCVRELLGDVYFGEHRIECINGIRHACDVMSYDELGIREIAHVAFRAAKKKVTSVDKANVLACSKLWREVVEEVAKEYACQLEHILVDNCAMQLIKNPEAFDVLLMPNMFGDILSDEASMLAGSLGMLPSASLNKDGFGLYEPASGSAPDIAGKGIANPIGQILSAAMMLEYSFQLHAEAKTLQCAVEETIKQGNKTRDLNGSLNTIEIGNIIRSNICRH